MSERIERDPETDRLIEARRRWIDAELAAGRNPGLIVQDETEEEQRDGQGEGPRAP